MGSSDRGQSAAVGYVLIIGVAVLTIGAVLALGGSAISDTQEQTRVDQAEKVFSTLDSRISQVALGYSDGKGVQTGLQVDASGVSMEHRKSGWVNITYRNISTGAGTTVINKTLGSIVYNDSRESVAYQGGGVWRYTSNTNGSSMVSPPEFHYREGTLTFALLTVDGDRSLRKKIHVDRKSEPSKVFPNPSAGFQNPLVEKKVTVTIHSKYYQAWGRYFETRTDGGVTYDHPANQVTVTLLKPPDPREIEEPVTIIGGSGGRGTLEIQSGRNGVIDSYNSSTIPDSLGPSNPPTTAGDGGLVTDKEIQFTGNAQITGSVTTSDTVSSFGGGGTAINGYLSYGKTSSVVPSGCSGQVNNGCFQNASFSPPEPLTAEVQSTINTIKTNRDNGAEPCFSESAGLKSSGSCSGTVTMEAGDYYTDQDFVVDNRKLLLDTTNGDIRIAVDNDKTVEFTRNNGNVTIVGNGTVRFYGTERYEVTRGARTWNRGWDANQLWLFCTADCQVKMKNDISFVGTVYAPSSSGTSNAGVTVTTGQLEVFGAIVGGGTSELSANADIHFDRALQSYRVLKRPSLPVISYLHVTSYPIEVSG